MIKELNKDRIYAEAIIRNIDMKEVGIVQYTGSVVVEYKEPPKSVTRMGPIGGGSPRPGYGGSGPRPGLSGASPMVSSLARETSDLEKEVQLPYQMKVTDSASRADIEERLATMADRDYCAPVRLNLWNSVAAMKTDDKPDYSGFADGSKADKLGIIASEKEGLGKQLIKIYDDETSWPVSMYKEEEKPAEPVKSPIITEPPKAPEPEPVVDEPVAETGKSDDGAGEDDGDDNGDNGDEDDGSDGDDDGSSSGGY